MKIAIGSTNKAKVKAVQAVFETADVTAISVPSGVSAQPCTDDETLRGAINRAKAAIIKAESNIGIGLEGGVMELEDGMYLCNWGAMIDRKGISVSAGGARIKLPEEVAEGVRKGSELSEVMDSYTKLHDVRSNQGAIGIFTNGLVERRKMFIHVLELLAGQYDYLKKKGLSS